MFKNISYRKKVSGRYLNETEGVTRMQDVTIHEYEKMNEDFYDVQTMSVNPLRAWFHKRRFELVQRTVRQYYKRGNVIVDLACGNCNWNADCIPVIGVDVSGKMLQYALKKKRIVKMFVENCENVSLKNESADIVVFGEALEHMPVPEKVLKEIYRILKRGGLLICTVPYDTNISLWKPLFKIQCLIQGYILGDEYYRKECGHVNHFSPEKVRALLRRYGLHPVQTFNNWRFTIFTVAKKD